MTDLEPGPRGWRDRGWRGHAIVFVVAVGGVIGLWQLTRDPDPDPKDYGADYWWPLWFGLVWGVVVLVHYLHAAGWLNLLPWLRSTPPRSAREDTATASTDDATMLDSLTAREREILILLAQGYANKELARRLHISERTARTHVSTILRKLELRSRTQAALLAARLGLIAETNRD